MRTEIRAVARHQLVLLRRAPGPVISYTVMPLLLIGLLEPVQVELTGSATAGAVRAATGMLVMFCLFMTGVVGSGLVQERLWGTAERLASTPLQQLGFLTGKASPLLAVLLAQQAAVLGWAAVAYRFDPARCALALATVGVAWAICVLGCGILVAGLVRTMSQLGAVKDIGTLTLAGLGGAVIPVEALPGWAGTLAPVSPAYWAMRGYRQALAGLGPFDPWPVVVLLAVGVAGLLIGAQAGSRPMKPISRS
jgi:ABC-2 type transport system permease protein